MSDRLNALRNERIDILSRMVQDLRAQLEDTQRQLTQARAAVEAERYARERAQQALRVIGAHTIDARILALVAQGLGEAE